MARFAAKLWQFVREKSDDKNNVVKVGVLIIVAVPAVAGAVAVAVLLSGTNLDAVPPVVVLAVTMTAAVAIAAVSVAAVNLLEQQ